MNNLVLITSIIRTTNTPLSYTSNRSVFSSDVRFEQTKNTIKTIREKIPNSKIIMVECSNLDDEQNDFFLENTDYFINLIDKQSSIHNIYSESKSLGEGTMTIEAINYINENNIVFDNFFKLSGRYWLSESFEYKNFDNNNIIVHNYQDYLYSTCTALYKLHHSNVNHFYYFLNSNFELMNRCIGYEYLFYMFLELPKHNKVLHLDKIGVKGYIAVSNDCLIDN
jgi:hypothetical protein